jgi:glutamine synthetase
MYELSTEELKRRGIDMLPRTLLEAVEAFETDALVDEVFSRELKEGFVRYKRKEWTDFHNVVTDWEVQRYLEMF